MRIACTAAIFSLALMTTLARAEKTEQSMPSNAFLFEARLAGATAVGIGLITGSVLTVPSFLMGARLINRLHVGLGFSFIRADTGASATNIVTFTPTVAFDLVQSHDERVALYLKAGLPIGPVITCPNVGPCDNGFDVGFDFALGTRYALHRMFALGLEAGASGIFLNPQRTTNTGLVAFYGALVGTFFYGH